MEQLLHSLLSTNNAERDSAEKRFHEALKNDVRTAMNELLQTVLVGQNFALCIHGAVLFRGQLEKQSVGKRWWQTLNQVEIESLKNAIIDRLSSANDAKLKRHIGQIIAEIASLCMVPVTTATEDEDNFEMNDLWPDLLGKLGAFIPHNADGGILSNAAVTTLGELVRCCPHKFTDGAVQVQLQDMLINVLTNPIGNSNNNRVGAIFTMSEVLQLIEEEQNGLFIRGLEALMRSLEPIVMCQPLNEDHLIKWFQGMIDVITYQPTLFAMPGSSLGNDLLVAMIRIASNDNNQFSDDILKQSLEVILTLLSQVPALLIETPELIQAILKVSTKFMVISTDEPDDFHEDDIDGLGDDEDILVAGARCVSYLCEFITEDIMLPILFPMIEEGLNTQQLVSQDPNHWRKQRAALISLERAAYCGGKLFYENLESIITRVLPFVTSEQVTLKVRLCAIDALCAINTSYNEIDVLYEDEDEDLELDEIPERKNVQALFIKPLLEAVFIVISEPKANTKGEWALKAKGAYCCYTFCCGWCSYEGQGAKQLGPYAREILGKIHRLIELSNVVQNQQMQILQQTGSLENNSIGAIDILLVQTNCLDAVSMMAIALGEEFIPYYDTFMPIAQQVYQLQDNTKSSNVGKKDDNKTNRRGFKQSQLRGTALEAIYNMGQAAGKEKFSNDADNLIGMVVHYMDNLWGTGEDEDRNRQVAQLAVNICTWKENVDPNVIGKIIPKFVAWAEKDACTFKAYADLNDDEDEEEEDENIQCFPSQVQINGEIKEGILTRNIYIIKDKEFAIRMLQELITGLGPDLMQWAGQLANTMAKELASSEEESQFDNAAYNSTADCQLCAAVAMAELVDATHQYLFKKQGLAMMSPEQKAFAQQIFDNALKCCFNTLNYNFTCAVQEDPDLIKEANLGHDLTNEMDDDFQVSSITALARQVSKILQTAYQSGGRTDLKVDVMLSSNYNLGNTVPVFGIPKEHLREWITKIMNFIKKILERPRGYPWWKESHLSEIMEYMSESLGYIIKAHCTDALPLFAELVFPLIMQMLEQPLSTATKKDKKKRNGKVPLAQQLNAAKNNNPNGISAVLKMSAVFVICDVIQFGGPEVQGIIPQVMPYMIQYANTPNSMLRQACAFCIGQCAEMGGQTFQQFLEPGMQALFQVCDKKGSRQGNQAGVTDNAISSLIRCVIFSQADLQQQIPKILSYLPSKDDTLEAQCNHYRIYKLLATNNPKFAPFQEQMKVILRKAAEDKTGYDEKKNKFIIEDAILSDETRAWVLQNLK